MSTAVALRPSPPEDDLDREVLTIGRQLAAGVATRRRRGHAAEDRMMAFLARDPELRAALFRLVDVAPACAGTRELSAHLAALLDGVAHRSRPVAWVSRAAGAPRAGRATGRVAMAGVRRMGRRFIVGASVEDAVPALGRLWEKGGASSVDLLGEATLTHEEAHAYADRCDAALVTLAAAAARWPGRPHLERDAIGPIPRVNLSVKVSALTPLIRGDAPDRGREDAAGHLRRLLSRARDLRAHLHLDTESLESRELILELVLSLLAEPQFADGPSVGVVLQAYLRDSEEVLTYLLSRLEGIDRTPPLTIRLVKGAYWDHETIQAAQHGWDPPVWTEKVESDRCFERLSRRLIDAYPRVRTAIASHNLRSISHAVAYARSTGMAPEDLEVQVLRGLGDDLQGALIGTGLRGRTYCPVGDIVAGMAYLVRRLLENTSNDSFLSQRNGGTSVEGLLRRP